MDKYNGLLSKVSRQYHILRGTQVKCYNKVVTKVANKI